MKNKKYLWVLLFLVLFSSKLFSTGALEAKREFLMLKSLNISPQCAIKLCNERNTSQYYKRNNQTYKEIVNAFITKEFKNIYIFFYRHDFFDGLENNKPKIIAGIAPKLGFHIYYYHNQFSKINDKLTRVDPALFSPEDLHTMNLNSVLAFYNPINRKVFFDASEYLHIDRFLKGKNPTKKRSKKAISTLAHEIFHSLESNPAKIVPRNPMLRKKKNVKKVPTLTWISEPIAEAVGNVYISNFSSSRTVYFSSMLLDIPFNFTKYEDLPYHRYPFFLWLGDKLNSKSNIGYLKNFREQTENGLKSFEKSLKLSNSKPFNIIYPQYIADVAHNPKSYLSLKAKASDYFKDNLDILIKAAPKRSKLKPFKFHITKEERTIYIEKKIQRSVKPLAVSPHILMAKYTGLDNATQADLLRLVTIKINPTDKKSPKDLTLVHEDKVFSEKPKEIDERTVRILVKATKKTSLGLSKVVNVAKDLTKTKKHDFEIIIKDEPFHPKPIGCIKPNKKIDLSMEGLRKKDDKRSIFNSKNVYLKPKKGKFDKKGSTIWIAPSQNGKVWADLIIEDVIVHDNKKISTMKKGKKGKDIKIKNFIEIRVSKNCGAKASLKNATGQNLGTVTYDDKKKITLVEIEEDPENIMLLKSPMIYNKDPEEGWCHVNLESFTQMFFQSTYSTFGGSKKIKIANKFREMANGLESVNPSTAKDFRKISSELKKTKFSPNGINLPINNEEKNLNFYPPSQSKNNKEADQIVNIKKSKNQVDLNIQTQVLTYEINGTTCVFDINASLHNVFTLDKNLTYINCEKSKNTILVGSASNGANPKEPTKIPNPKNPKEPTNIPNNSKEPKDSDEPLALPSKLEKDFDFYRLPIAINKMISLHRLRTAVKKRYENNISVTGDLMHITIANKPCRDNTSRLCKFATMEETEGSSDIEVLYNELNLISKIEVEEQVMEFEYKAYTVQEVPSFAPSCFKK